MPQLIYSTTFTIAGIGGHSDYLSLPPWPVSNRSYIAPLLVLRAPTGTPTATTTRPSQRALPLWPKVANGSKLTMCVTGTYDVLEVDG